MLMTALSSELLPIARQKLDQVARALNDTDPNQKISVEGHADSQGNDASNQRLSQDRADSVRAYLVQQGVPHDRITSVGQGETTPIAPNETAEGRANSRRVEIVVQKKSGQ
jgi:outer membrane protein OmpA-like peptidoglycan-associated protein